MAMVTLINDEIVLMPLLDALALQERKQNNEKKKKQKTLQQRQQQWKRNQDKRERNQQLSRLPTFTSDQPYKVIFINYMTAYFVILRLIERARKTKYFSIDTETDDITRKPALIQIEFVQFEQNNDVREEKIIVVFEMCQLPSKTSWIYPRVQQLLEAIFHPSKTFLTWDNEKNQLFKFIIYQLFETVPIGALYFINVQDGFKDWYNNTYKHEDDCYMATFNDISDDPECTCSHRPYKNPGDKWSLQRAVSTIFKQFLDKSLTRNNWGQGLDIRLYQNIQPDVPLYDITSCLTEEQEQNRLELVQYAIDDCLALTKVAFTIGKYLVSVTLNISFYFSYIF